MTAGKDLLKARVQDEDTHLRPIKHYIDKTAELPMQKLCKERQEMFPHIISECPVLNPNRHKNGNTTKSLRPYTRIYATKLVRP